MIYTHNISAVSNTVDIDAWHVERPFDYQQSISFMPISILLVYLYGRVNHTLKRVCGLSKQVIGIVRIVEREVTVEKDKTIEVVLLLLRPSIQTHDYVTT